MMAREEAIERIKNHMKHHGIGEYPHIKLAQALELALSALRPVSRERVEKVWSGCNKCTSCELCMWNETRRCHDCKDRALFTPFLEFCPKCGKPLKDEAVQMVMDRLEALYETE